MTAFEGADLDDVQPEQAHKGDGTKFINTASTKDSQTIEDLVIFLKTGPGIFLLTDEGDIENYLGVGSRPLKGDTLEVCQLYLIKKVLYLLDLPHSVKGNSRPANKKLLSWDENGPSRKHYWKS